MRKKAIAALRKTQAVYPGLKLEDAEGGIIVNMSSRPAVPYKPSRRLILCFPFVGFFNAETVPHNYAETVLKPLRLTGETVLSFL